MTRLALAGKCGGLRRERVADRPRRRRRRRRPACGDRPETARRRRAGRPGPASPSPCRPGRAARGGDHGVSESRFMDGVLAVGTQDADPRIQSTNINSFVISSTWASCSHAGRAGNRPWLARRGPGSRRRNRAAACELRRVGRPGQDAAVERGDPALRSMARRRPRAGRPAPWPARCTNGRFMLNRACWGTVVLGRRSADWSGLAKSKARKTAGRLWRSTRP